MTRIGIVAVASTAATSPDESRGFQSGAAETREAVFGAFVEVSYT